jgi:hypothetical protein
MPVVVSDNAYDPFMAKDGHAALGLRPGDTYWQQRTGVGVDCLRKIGRPAPGIATGDCVLNVCVPVDSPPLYGKVAPLIGTGDLVFVAESPLAVCPPAVGYCWPWSIGVEIDRTLTTVSGVTYALIHRSGTIPLPRALILTFRGEGYWRFDPNSVYPDGWGGAYGLSSVLPDGRVTHPLLFFLALTGLPWRFRISLPVTAGPEHHRPHMGTASPIVAYGRKGAMPLEQIIRHEPGETWHAELFLGTPSGDLRLEDPDFVAPGRLAFAPSPKHTLSGWRYWPTADPIPSGWEWTSE